MKRPQRYQSLRDRAKRANVHELSNSRVLRRGDPSWMNFQSHAQSPANTSQLDAGTFAEVADTTTGSDEIKADAARIVD